jgi:predicted transcriptional regulator of viral defense system
LYVALEDRIMVQLYRAASLAGRPAIAVPSLDLEATASAVGNRSARQALSRLVHAGRVLSVRKDLVVLPDATGRVVVGMPELVGVVAPSPYLITGGRALEKSRLTDQHFFSIVVLTPSVVSGFSFRGERAVFMTTEPARIWGWEDDQSPRFATPERAVVDSVSHARYGVSLPIAIDALHRAAERDPEFLARLVDVTRRYDSTAAARRVGLLVDRLFGEEAAEPFRELVGESRTPVLLRSTGDAHGPVDRAWRVVGNASTEPEATGP